jgi:hypothetical protein
MICWRFVGSAAAHSCDERQTIEKGADGGGGVTPGECSLAGFAGTPDG